MMIGFPALMYYFWVSLEFHHGKIFLPSSYTKEGLADFLQTEILNKVVTAGLPTVKATKIYMGYVLFSFILAQVMPGPSVHGLPIPSLKGKRVLYHCNGLSSWYLILITSAVLHVSGIFRLTEIIDNFGPIMSVAIIWGFVMSTLVYVSSAINGTQHRMSGNIFYDYFMGGPLNPRIGHVDLKMWAEIRIPWPVLFYISVSCLLKQYELTGQITGPQAFMVLAHFLYVNACQKGEECIPTSWDMFYEKDGFMLIFWNMAGVPFTYCYASVYLMKYQLTTGEAITHSLPYTIFLYVFLLLAYYVFDTGNSQKNRFRMEQNSSFIVRNAFPQLPWGHIKNPSYIKTKHGNSLLTSGWWGIVRKPHYTADLCMSISWGLITGFGSFLPYFYFCFFLVVLTHRVSRDMERCAKKYGDDWVRYCERVPYIFVPYVF
ncbi:ergosterol biosynthesis ERG4/ERG24 [Dichotomocladium elegans]|nr:ergosterol biosynthesis ERG4/ERG24 [Dichotomocladium elegans]